MTDTPPPNIPVDDARPRRGRPRIHADNAGRSRAYRARKAGARDNADGRVERLLNHLADARTDNSRLRLRIAELEQFVAEHAAIACDDAATDDGGAVS